MAINLPALKKAKNSVIGNPSAKLKLAKDEEFVAMLVISLDPPAIALKEAQGSRDDIRTEAAHVISSITYGSQEALRSLLRAGALQTLVYAIAQLEKSDPIPLKSAFARALRALAVAIAETVGPTQWGLHPDNSEIRVEAKAALEYLFEGDHLDVYLPLLVDTSTQTSTSIAQLLAATVRSDSHRIAVAEWLPFSERLKEIKVKRGWERPDRSNSNAPSRQGGWVARNLVTLFHSRDTKLQEAALSALASLVKDNVPMAIVMAAPERDSPPPLSFILSLTKSRSTDVQLAACLCATNIIRANASNRPSFAESSSALTVLHVVNRMVASSSDSTQVRTRACFILYHLITDDNELCQTAVERGSLEKLATLVKDITPLEKRDEWDEDESENISCLREAALMSVAALSLFDNDIRRDVTDNLQLIPIIHAALGQQHVGVRYAACQCVRALSRAVAIVRTNIVDSGLGMDVFRIFKREDEDRRVTFAALLAICNIVNEFSPLRPKYLEQGIMPRLVQLLSSGDPTLRFNVLWAIKNLVRKTTTETKRSVMNYIGWHEFALILKGPDMRVEEQAWAIVRNLAEHESGIDMVLREFGADLILECITKALDSPDEDVVLQAAYALANLCNGHETHQNIIIDHPKVLDSLHKCLEDASADIRSPAVCAILELAKGNPKRRKEIGTPQILSTLRCICDNGVSVSPGGRSGYMMHPDDDKEVKDQARQALDFLEHGGEIDFLT